MDDGAHTIFLSTKGTNKDETTPELIRFLQYVERPTDEELKSDDAFVRSLKETVKRVKVDREMGARYMTWDDMIDEEREEAFAEGKLEGKLDLIQKKLAKGQSVEQIADALEETVEVIEELIEQFSK